MRSPLKLWILSAVLGVTLVAVAFWNVVLHESGWNLTFVIWPGLLAGFFTGGNYHNGFDRTESAIAFAASAGFWTMLFFGVLSIARALFARKPAGKAAPDQPPAGRSRFSDN